MYQQNKHGRGGGGGQGADDHHVSDQPNGNVMVQQQDQPHQSNKKPKIQPNNQLVWKPKGQKPEGESSQAQPTSSTAEKMMIPVAHQDSTIQNSEGGGNSQQMTHSNRGRGGRGGARDQAPRERKPMQPRNNQEQQQQQTIQQEIPATIFSDQQPQQMSNQSQPWTPNQNSRGRGGAAQRGAGRGGHQQQPRNDYQPRYQIAHTTQDGQQIPSRQDIMTQGSDESHQQQSSNRGGNRGGRGRGGDQQRQMRGGDHTQHPRGGGHQDGQRAPIDETQGQQPTRGGQGKRGGRGGRGGHQDRPQTTPALNNEASSSSSFFQDRKYEQERFGSKYTGLPSNATQGMLQANMDKVNSSANDQRMWSRKMDQGKGKPLRLTKGLGSTANYLGGGFDDSEDHQFTKQEKIAFINEEEERKEKAAKEQALVKYNYQDFLKQFGGLTEQCTYLVETLSKGTQECIICHNAIYQRSALWNCNQCHQPFHLGCIKRWIKKLNNNADDEEEKKEPPRRPGQVEEEETESRKIVKKLLAFFSWTCPNCNYSYTENSMPKYFCYCGKYDEPEYSPLTLPHSCGEYCDRKKHEHCTHSNCDVLCHPGSCPSCNINVPVQCFCHKETRRIPCSIAPRGQFSCEGTCGKLLNCLKHECQDTCHQGPCQKCNEEIQIKCFCEKEERTVKCGSKKFVCNNICNKQLDCGKHNCRKVCHEGPCQPCQKTPQRVKFCPCGRKEIVALIGKERRECTDKIPVCQTGICEKFLPCQRHQCIQKCHNEDCQRCEALVEQICQCGKDRRMVPCYKIYYPEHLKLQMMTSEEIEDIENYKCKKICGQLQSCQKHKCKEVCCPVKKGVRDPLGRHLCLKTCQKTLSCGKHQCGAFCHLGLCKPCKWMSTQPLYCPCGNSKVDPPILCETPQPTCQNKCKKINSCGHQCTLKCHNGNCPPCLEEVTKICACGKEIQPNTYCNQQPNSCGITCALALPCGHTCPKVCHKVGECFTTREELMEKGCSTPCGKPLKYCKHRCQETCHPLRECEIDTPCEAEIRVYCKCGFRFVNTICKSIPDREPIECNSDCWKKQREMKLALAFGSTPSSGSLSGEQVKLEYYPEEVLEFATENPKFVEKCERLLTDVVLEKTTRSFSGLTSAKRAFLATLVFEHFKLDMCTYGSRNSKTVTDVFWSEGCKVPDVLVSEVIKLIERGIMSADNSENRDSIFEATLYFSNVTKGATIDDLKKFLMNFRNEMYTQKGKQQGHFSVHFYKKSRAKDALTFIRNTPNQFTNVDLVIHKKEIGTIGDMTPLQAQQLAAAAEKKRIKKEKVFDADGFEVTK